MRKWHRDLPTLDVSKQRPPGSGDHIKGILELEKHTPAGVAHVVGHDQAAFEKEHIELESVRSRENRFA
jgi:hypothetical protein